MKTAEVVEAALMPDLLYRVTSKTFKNGPKAKDTFNAELINEALHRDVLRYRDLLSKSAQDTFDRYLERTAVKLMDKLKNTKQGNWDTVSVLSTLLELCKIFDKQECMKVTEDLQYAVFHTYKLLDTQHGKAWDGMQKAARKRARKLLKIMQEAGYYTSIDIDSLGSDE